MACVICASVSSMIQEFQVPDETMIPAGPNSASCAVKLWRPDAKNELAVRRAMYDYTA
jgi:hypothetical protein